MLRFVVVAVVLAAGCRRVERLPSEPASTQPSPAMLEYQRGPAPAQPQHPTTPPVPPNTPEQPPDPNPTAQTPTPPTPTGPDIPAPVGCPADRIKNLSHANVQIPDCSDEARCRSDCAGGSAAACFAYASVVQGDPDRRGDTAAMFARACELGMAIACTNYGAGIWNPGGGEAAEQCAHQLFEKACAVKEPFACGMLGRMLVSAATDDASRALARAQLEKSCNELTGPPCKMLADYLKSGKLGAADPAQIQALLEKACDGGDGLACQDIGRAAPP